MAVHDAADAAFSKDSCPPVLPTPKQWQDMEPQEVGLIVAVMFAVVAGGAIGGLPRALNELVI